MPRVPVSARLDSPQRHRAWHSGQPIFADPVVQPVDAVLGHGVDAELRYLERGRRVLHQWSTGGPPGNCRGRDLCRWNWLSCAGK